MKQRNSEGPNVRQLVDRRLPVPMTDREWVIVEKRYGAEIRETSSSQRWQPAWDAAKFVLDARTMESEDLPRGPRMLLSGGRNIRETNMGEWTREVFVSIAVAGYAYHDADVCTFRQDMLGDPFATLSDSKSGPDDPAAWIEQKWTREQVEPLPDIPNGDLPLLYYAPLPRTGDTREMDETVTGDGAEDGASDLHTLPVRMLRVVPGGVLDQLRLLGERLARDYRWESPAAITFVLTGAIPVIQMLTTRLDWHSDHHDLSVLTRIVLTVDPSMTPDEVAEAYRQLRRNVVRQLPRRMDEKSMWLAALTTGNPPATTLSSMMKWWNDSGPGWPYDDVRKFGRERRDAERRLLHPDYRRPVKD